MYNDGLGMRPSALLQRKVVHVPCNIVSTCGIHQYPPHKLPLDATARTVYEPIVTAHTNTYIRARVHMHTTTHVRTYPITYNPPTTQSRQLAPCWPEHFYGQRCTHSSLGKVGHVCIFSRLHPNQTRPWQFSVGTTHTMHVYTARMIYVRTC